MDVSKYRSLFIAESREHLEATSQLLVAIEAAAADAAPGLVDEVFRHVHSLKGMAASMGYDPITALAHHLEDVVGRAPRPLGRDVVDLLLQTVDALSAQVECIAAERPLEQHAELLRRLRTAGGGEPTAAGSERAADVVAPATRARPAPAAADGSASRVIRVRLDEASSSPQVRAFLVARKVADLVQVAAAKPTVEEIKAGRLTGFELEFRVEQPFDEAAVRRKLEAEADVEAVSIEAAVEGGRPMTQEPPAPLPAAAPAPAPASASATIRVRTAILDDLIDSVGELFIARERLQSLLGAASAEALGALDALDRRVREVHDRVMAVRMIPLRTLTDRYPRLVRDLGRTLEKDVVLEVQGGEIEIDRAVLDNLETPFVHVLRNAVDHGVESPAERLARDKSAAGKVVISALRDREAVVVTVQDDGRGLDPAALRERAVRLGLVTQQQVEGMSASEAFFLVCLPGFSTRQEVSDVSGRGVGMDAVRSMIEGMGGTLDIESELGRGTRITFRLPLTLAIIPVLLVEAANRLFALPAAKVVSIREPGDDIFEQAGGNVYLSFQHALVRITPLAQLLGMSRRARIKYVVVLEDGRDLYAIAVDRVAGYQDVVVKPLGDPLDRLHWFSGATVRGDGQPILILDLPKALRLRTAA